MKIMKHPLFKDFCYLIAFLFFFETILPTAFGLPLPQIEWKFGPAEAYAQGPEWLSSTVDADYDDRFIQEKLTEIGTGIDAAFGFVRDEISYEAYVGSLRGARGTMWSRAGNSLDQASLLIALLRSQGIACRYAHGRLSDDDAKILISSMFDPEAMANAVGYIPERYSRADPVNDPELLSQVKDHWWVELEEGTQVDPTFRDGTPRTSVEETFFEVPDNLRHKVTIRLKAEFHNMLSQYTYKTPLDVTFTTAEVYGRPLTLGHFVSTYQPPSLIGGFKTYTYSPYLIVEDNDNDPSNNHIIQGKSYQEFFSSLIPMANSTLTKLTLEIEVDDPGKESEVRSRDLLDRVGYAARHGTAQPKPVDTQKPAIMELEQTTIFITPGFISWDGVEPLQEALRNLSEQANVLASKVDAVMEKDPAQWTAEDKNIVKEHTNISRSIERLGCNITGALFLSDSDYYTGVMSKRQLALAYYDSPRLTLVMTRVKFTANADETTLSLALDLRRNSIHVIPYPGQNEKMPFLFNMRKGMLDSRIEFMLVKKLLSSTTEVRRMAPSAMTVLEAARNQGIPIKVLAGPKDIPTRLESLEISPEAKTRIAEALRSYHTVNVPARMVDVDGVSSIGWFEVDGRTGELVSVTEDGGHQELLEMALVTSILFVGLPMTLCIFWGKIASFFGQDDTLSNYKPIPDMDGYPCIDISASEETPPEISGWEIYESAYTIKIDGENVTFEIDDRLLEYTTFSTYLLPEYIQVTGSSGSIIDYSGHDIEVITLFGSGQSEDSGEILTAPGMTLETVPDRAFAVKIGESQLPASFRVRIGNTGSDTDFELNGTTPSGWRLLIARGTNPIPADKTGEVSVFLQPQESTTLPPPGTIISFSITASRQDNPSSSLTQDVDFVMPELYALNVKACPEAVYTTPTGSVTTELHLTNTGNVAQTITLNPNIPDGLSITGLETPINLDPGESLTRTLTFTANGLELDTDYYAKVVATYGESGDKEKEVSLRIHVAAPGSIQALNSANYAETMGRDDLARTLETLGQDMSHLYQEQGSEVYRSRVTCGLSNLIGQLDDPLLSPFAEAINTSLNTISNSTPDNMETALDDLASALSGLENRLSILAEHDFECALRPNSATALPETPTRFNLYLKNKGNKTTTYDLSLSDLPDGVSGELNQTSITLPPGYSIVPGLSGTNILPVEVYVTITQPAHELSAFQFKVNITPRESPDIARSADGLFVARDELVSVTSVVTTPVFTEPGGEVDVKARVLNAVNSDRTVFFSFAVKDSAGTEVYRSEAKETKLTVVSSLDTYDLGSFDTAGLSTGSYSIEVFGFDEDGQPIAGAKGKGNLLVGSPINASMWLTPDTLP
ncbi:MAG TPA: hypothetical protein ENG51_05165, partial [Deltaproteobacteria bacterium]|nr:hypothetical protein [Deltaproteobacteria bacterium]